MKYLLALTVLIGICLAIYQIPLNPDRYGWLRLTAVILGISTFVHLVTVLLRLKSWRKWLFAGIVPTVGVIVWYVYGVRTGSRHPGSIGVYGFLTGGLFWFPIGFAIVDGLMTAINGVGQSESSAESVG